MKNRLREGFRSRVDPEEYLSEGFGEPHTNAQWHFLTKEILLEETDTPVSDILVALDVLLSFKPVLDEIAENR